MNGFKGNFKRTVQSNTREIALLGIIVILAVLVNFRSGGNFLTAQNIGDMLTETSIMLIAVIGMMMVVITSGIDLSIGSTMALAGMVATKTLQHNTWMPPALIIVIAVVVGIAAGFVNGFLISRLKVIPIIATLGTMNVFRGIAYLVGDGSWVLQQNMTAEFMNVATGKLLGINNLIWISAIITLICLYYLNRTRSGRRIYAVGNSEESAEVSGINTKNTLLRVYVLMGALAGLAGVLYVCKYAAAQGETATGYEMNVIASCVLGGVSISGGTGKVHGVFLGSLLFGMLNNALPLLNISPFWQDALRGAIILVSIIVNVIIARRVDRRALERRANQS